MGTSDDVGPVYIPSGFGAFDSGGNLNCGDIARHVPVYANGKVICFSCRALLRLGRLGHGARLREVGEGLYGRRWQSNLARALGVQVRRLRYWLQGVKPPETLEADLRRIVSERIAALAKLLE